MKVTVNVYMQALNKYSYERFARTNFSEAMLCRLNKKIVCLKEVDDMGVDYMLKEFSRYGG